MRRLIVGVILILMTAAIWAYPDEPSDSQLIGWWLELDRDEQIAELRDMDRAEHGTATVGGAELVVIQTRNGTIRAFFDGPLSIDIEGVFLYDVPVEELPAVTIQGNPEINVWPWIGGGIVAGIVATLLLSGVVR